MSAEENVKMLFEIVEMRKPGHIAKRKKEISKMMEPDTYEKAERIGRLLDVAFDNKLKI